ncbi:dTMP kinase [Candidatus Peregrinibacteria bacterium CG10_big_fil_rev_8_21_14_0_10_55_24]|nr:MAG: dTMP kinase [Candidatus Peregrinibacteria bacterium CG10_big_fil_rev_8_21_14_0_10_55_24]
MRGLFIVIEGPDGSGTTRHTQLLADRLTAAKIPVLSTFEPTDGPVGSRIRSDLRSGAGFDPLSLQELFCKDRAWHLSAVIEPALAKGVMVISDRYFHSTLAYGQALKIPKEKLEELNKKFIQPDVLFFLLPPYEVCSERMVHRETRDALEEDSIQRRVYAQYQAMAEELPSVHIIDTSGEKETVADGIFAVVEEALRHRTTNPRTEP